MGKGVHQIFGLAGEDLLLLLHLAFPTFVGAPSGSVPRVQTRRGCGRGFGLSADGGMLCFYMGAILVPAYADTRAERGCG